ncbi:hypothetical protein KAM448_36640 [Aeromonas caviae]|uniref:Uncharacterized protein n=1 Tax=Aeromonas caviae TaxID=648 RepID=A0ABD0B8A4_AERCA|nr:MULTISPECIES: hypothetical protein [Aeromonas]BCK65855.1 hypothetical protein KAM330_48440 [Aeromonas hydrophila]BCR31446.1 hypothetical protein KAM376_44520 [Aeromonas caviae]GJA71890.1 hypothetical protein KAM353_15370 [Aeromonas caviae]GJA81641.1 hypothetical protein KAM355_22010 [Aeromonas caviae]GJB00133.1 hypothetical protein KAM359_35400 [Aeromonas caviae]
MFETVKLIWAVLVAGVPTLIAGIVVLWLLQLGKKDARQRGTGQGWAKLQLIVALGTVLIICWQVYGVTHPSRDEVQWQQEVGDYGLMN